MTLKTRFVCKSNKVSSWLDFGSVCVYLYLSTILYRIRNKISKMEKYVAVLFRRWFRFAQLWVLITLWLPVISVTRCWRALIWSMVSVVKEKIVPTAVCCATNRQLLSDCWASTVLESQFHCRYWCCQGGVLSELSPSPYKSTNEGLGNLHKSFYARSY